MNHKNSCKECANAGLIFNSNQFGDNLLEVNLSDLNRGTYLFCCIIADKKAERKILQ